MLKPVLNSRHEKIFCNKHSGVSFVTNYRSNILTSSIAKNKNDVHYIEEQHRHNSNTNDPVTNSARYSSRSRKNNGGAVSRKRKVSRKVFKNHNRYEFHHTVNGNF